MDCCITKTKFGEVVLTTSFFSESEACLTYYTGPVKRENR